MARFMGEFNHTIDNKGRLIIPARFREQLGETFVLTVGIDGCLNIFENEAWDAFVEQLNATAMGNKQARMTKRYFLSQAVPCELDKQGRILIPQSLRDKASLAKDVVLAGVGNRIEIWDEEIWNEQMNIDEMDIAAAMEGLGI